MWRVFCDLLVFLKIIMLYYTGIVEHYNVRHETDPCLICPKTVLWKTVPQDVTYDLTKRE